MGNLITSDTDSLSSLIIFSNFDDKTEDYIIVNSKAKYMTYGTDNYVSGADIDSETA